MRKPYIPYADNAFHSWQDNLIANVAPRAEELRIPADTVEAVQVLQTRWDTAFAIANALTTRTKGAVHEKQEARKAYEATLRKFVKSYLTYNPLLSDKDRDDMGLPVHKTSRTPAPVAAEPPDCDTDTSVAGQVTFYYYPKGGGWSSAKPDGQRGAELAWAILDAPTIEWSDLVHSASDTHTPLILRFEGHDRGKVLYYALRWENTRGLKGPWSIIQSTIIP